VVEGLVPAIEPDDYLKKARPKRSITAKKNSLPLDISQNWLLQSTHTDTATDFGRTKCLQRSYPKIEMESSL